MISRALVLTAGLGTRMRPLSQIRAKPAVPIAGEPLVRRIVRWLSTYGVCDLVLNLHHLPHTITAQLGDGADLGTRIRYSWENPILGSAGGPRKALALLGNDSFFVINGDTLTNVDLRGLADAHARTEALVTLAVTRNPAQERYSGPLVDDNGTVRGFTGRGSSASSLFVGVQVVDRSVFADLPVDQPAESISGVYRTLLADRPGSIQAFRSDSPFWDVGTPQDYLRTTLAFAKAEGLSSIPVGRHSRVHPSARLVDTEVWDEVDIGADVELTRCIVADGASIPRGTKLADCAIVPAPGRHATGAERRVGDLFVVDLDRSCEA